jgi:cytoskeletal protein CcmA (bactofilin family)
MIGKTITIRGELSGDNDVVVDGRLEGKVNLTRSFAVGKNGSVEADVSALGVTLAGRFKGNIVANQRVAIDSSASVVGNITAPRLSISDGAYFKGAVEMEGSSRPKPVEGPPDEPGPEAV